MNQSMCHLVHWLIRQLALVESYLLPGIGLAFGGAVTVMAGLL